jgi:hypothetical protein
MEVTTKWRSQRSSFSSPEWFFTDFKPILTSKISGLCLEVIKIARMEDREVFPFRKLVYGHHRKNNSPQTGND